MRRLIVFDLDGTLFDTKRGIIAALNYVLQEYGISSIPTDQQDKYIGPPIKVSLMNYNGFSGEKSEEATNLYREVYVQRFISQSEPYPYLKETLSALRDLGFELGIATMKTQKQVDRLLDLFGLADSFGIIKTAREDGSLSKQQMLIDIREHYKSEIVDVVMVGDTQGDYEAAKNAKCDFIAADYGYGNINASLDTKRLNELKDIIKLLV